jgi:polyribonucleotide nucleotidyltransferase
MGLVDSTILTDISGAEDHIGDMDLKVAGTRQGITALQMDVKNEGVSPAVIADALTKARVAREKILEMMR